MQLAEFGPFGEAIIGLPKKSDNDSFTFLIISVVVLLGIYYVLREDEIKKNKKEEQHDLTSF